MQSKLFGNVIWSSINILASNLFTVLKTNLLKSGTLLKSRLRMSGMESKHTQAMPGAVLKTKQQRYLRLYAISFPKSGTMSVPQ